MDSDHAAEKLEDHEIFWRDRYYFFKNKGYILRPRYHPEWQASWRFERNPIFELFEDSIFQWVGYFSVQDGFLLTSRNVRKRRFLMLQRKGRMSSLKGWI